MLHGSVIHAMTAKATGEASTEGMILIWHMKTTCRICQHRGFSDIDGTPQF